MKHSIDSRLGLPSASSLPRVYSCPGSSAMEARAPEAAPTSESMEGDEIHAAMEQEDFTELDEHAASIAEHLKLLESEALADWKKSVRVAGDLAVQRELRLWISNENRERIASAQPDMFTWSRPFGFVLDLKTGYLPVTDARRNIQARIQALALNEEYGPFARVRAVMASYRFRGRLTVCDYTSTDLERARDELRLNLWRAGQPDAPRVPGLDQCRYCKAKAFCPEAAAYAMLPVVTVAQGHQLTTEELLAAVSQLDPVALARLHSIKGLVEKVLEAVDVRLRALPRETLNEVGLDLGTPGTSREVADVQKLWGILYQHGVTEEQFRSLCKVPIGKVESVMIPKIRARDKETSDATAKKTVSKIIAPAVTVKEKAAPLIAFKKEIGQ